MTREEAKKAAVQLMEEALRPDNLTDEQWHIFMSYCYNYDEEKLADDLLVGLANGHSVEKQKEVAKIALWPYRKQFQESFKDWEDFANHVKNA